MSWLAPRRPKKSHSWKLPPPGLVPFNDHLKELDRRGLLGAYMAHWAAYERDRESAGGFTYDKGFTYIGRP